MPHALEIIGGKITNAGTTKTAYTPLSGDTFTVRNFAPGSRAFALRTWALSATAGYQQIHSPRWHDNVQGFRSTIIAADSRPTWSLGSWQRLQPQDVITYEATGGGSETDCGYLLNYYEDLPGVAGRFIDIAALNARGQNVLSVATSHTTSATAGEWGGTVAINSLTQLLKANTDYAILGFNLSLNCGAVRVTGPDTGNIGVGASGSSVRTVSREWFRDLTLSTGIPLIPVFNAANAGGTFVSLSVPATGSTVEVDTLLVELSS